MQIDEKKPTVHQMPIYYVYQDKDGWRRTDARFTEDLNKSFVMRRYKMPVGELQGYSFYPQFREPNADEVRSGLRIPAWRITKDGEIVARWEFVECEHKSWHRDCVRVSDSVCKRRCLLNLVWDSKRKVWILDRGQTA